MVQEIGGRFRPSLGFFVIFQKPPGSDILMTCLLSFSFSSSLSGLRRPHLVLISIHHLQKKVTSLFGNNWFSVWNIGKSKCLRSGTLIENAIIRKTWECFQLCSGPWHELCKISGHRVKAGGTKQAVWTGSFLLCLASHQHVAFNTGACWVMWFLNIHILGCTQKQPQLHVFYDDGTTKESPASQYLIQVQGLPCGL